MPANLLLGITHVQILPPIFSIFTWHGFLALAKRGFLDLTGDLDQMEIDMRPPRDERPTMGAVSQLGHRCFGYRWAQFTAIDTATV